MPEQQIIEYKSSWRDEFLAWICGYANAQGGTLFIGKNDIGDVVGVEDSRKLLEDLPNKIVNHLGIVADVNLHTDPEGDYIEIKVEPYPSPISYRGHYHYRSGSTKQELKGAALNKFLLAKQGLHWDAMALPDVGVTDLKKETLVFFRKKGIASERIDENLASGSDKVLLENL